MTGKERVSAAVNFTGPDRVPFIHSYLPAAFVKHPGLPELLRQYPSDIVGEGNVGLDNPLYKKGQWTDEFGCLWTVCEDGLLGQVTGHPLEKDEALPAYRWPSAYDTDISDIEKTAREKGDRYARLGWITFFERMVDLRGFENLLVDIYENSAVFAEMSRQVLKYNMDLIDRLLALDGDCIAFADDWGSQLNLLIHPAQWEEHFLPVYREMFQKVRAAGKHVFFHSDGYTMQILPKVVEAGANILWVDMTVNPMESLSELLGGKVCFQGLTDVQFLIRNGTPDEVRAYIKKLMRLFGNYNGGFIACSEIGPDQPWENIKAAVETFHEYGQYPLKI